MLAGCSYGPYSRAMVRICSEETFHHKQGKEMIVQYAQGTPEQRAMAQDALNRWWWPSVMMLGPHDADSPNSGVMSKWGIKLKSNDEVRQEYLNEHVPELLEAGLSIPDAELHQDEHGNWIHGPINWDEFWAIVKGEIGLNKERLASRQQRRMTTVPGCARRCWPTENGNGRRRRTEHGQIVTPQTPSGRAGKCLSRTAASKVHQAVGSVHAADPQHALFTARSVFARRPAAVSLWAVREDDILLRDA